MNYTKSEVIELLRSQLSKPTEEEMEKNPKLLERNTKQIHKALLTIYSYQTEEEQSDGYTEEYNGVGFTGCDSEFLSSLACNLQKYGKLSEKQNDCLFKLMPKYAKQLVEHSIKIGKIKCESRGKYYW